MIDDGKQRTCDICGAKIFLRHFMLNDTYSDADKDWERIDGIGDMCPDCAKAYHSMVDSLIEERGGGADETD